MGRKVLVDADELELFLKVFRGFLATVREAPPSLGVTMREAVEIDVPVVVVAEDVEDIQIEDAFEVGSATAYSSGDLPRIAPEMPFDPDPCVARMADLVTGRPALPMRPALPPPREMRAPEEGTPPPQLEPVPPMRGVVTPDPTPAPDMTGPFRVPPFAVSEAMAHARGRRCAAGDCGGRVNGDGALCDWHSGKWQERDAVDAPDVEVREQGPGALRGADDWVRKNLLDHRPLAEQAAGLLRRMRDGKGQD